MIEPVLSGRALLQSIASAGGPSIHLWWLGQSGFLVKSGGRHLLFDPYLSDSLTAKYADTGKPHERMTAIPVEPAKLNFIDVITSSHNHTDHLDGETLRPLLAANPQAAMITPAANLQFAANRLQVAESRLTGAELAQPVEIAGFKIHTVPAAHNQLETDEQGRHKFVGYVVETPAGTIYHSGDTLLYDGIEDHLRKFEIDIAILPINGNLPSRRVAGNLWGHEAAQLAHNIGARFVIPCHYEMFTFNTVDTTAFEAAAVELNQPHVVLKCGEPWTAPHPV